MADELELEAMRTDDCSWHPCQVYFSPTDGGLVIEYGNNGFQDILVSEKEALMRIRVCSIPLQDDDCTNIKPGDHIVVNQNSESKTGFFDAEVEKVIKVRHSKRATCRCTFIIKWIHQDLNGGTLTVPSSSVMKLANKNINNHPTISAFLDAVSPSNSCFSSMSPQLNLANDFDLDLHDLLEKQIEGIKNSVHGSKKRIRDEIMGSEGKLRNQQLEETDIFTPNVRDPEKDKKSPLNPLAARAALASLMSKSNGIDDFSEITEISLETETVTKPAKNVKKPLFSTKKVKDSDVSAIFMNSEIKTRLTRAKSPQVESIPDDVEGKKRSAVTNRRVTRSVLHKEDETVAIEIPTNGTTNSSNKRLFTRSVLHKDEETVAIEIPTYGTKNSSNKSRLTRSVLHKEEETVSIETTNIDTKNSTVAIETTTVDTENSSDKKRVTRSMVNHQDAANIKTETMKESIGDEPTETGERNKKKNSYGVVSETQDPKGIAGDVTSNGGSSYNSKKNSVDMNKHKVLRSSPRFHTKT